MIRLQRMATTARPSLLANFAAFVAMVLPIALTSQVCGKDYFLTIGGGYEPTGNQASLERNVKFQRHVLEQHAADAHREVYFADGDAPEPDLQVLDARARDECPPAVRMMTEIFGERESLGIEYRNHRVEGVQGPAELALLKRRLRELGRTLTEGDRLVIYVTAHGGEAYDDYEYDYEAEEWDEPDPEEAAEGASYDTTLHLWDEQSVTASEFARWLDRIPPKVPVVLVMVQCYSGGFAHNIFHKNDSTLGLAKAARCGFFAQVHDRPAAGCTADAQNADFHEYSTFFWGALAGETFAGEPLERPDYDGDGRTSFAEAHAYAVIESETIDIPVRTSEELLRTYSRLGGPSQAAEDGAATWNRFLDFLSQPAEAEPELLQASGPLESVAQRARPDQRAILEGLVRRLELPEPATVESVRQALEEATDAGETAGRSVANALEAYEEAEAELREDVVAQWPGLSSTFTPIAAELTGAQSGEFASFVEKLPSYEAFRAASQARDQVQDEAMDAGHCEAALQRLVRTIETVVLAANLKHAAPQEVVQRYEEMVALEEQGLE